MKYTETRDKAYWIQKQREYRVRHSHRTKVRWDEYYQANKEELIRKRVEYRREKMKTDPLYSFKVRLYGKFRSRLRSRSDLIQEICGCDKRSLLKHLNRTAIDRYGKSAKTERYEIDHIIPLGTAKTEEDVLRLWHYENLQYLKRHDNRSKGKEVIDW